MLLDERKRFHAVLALADHIHFLNAFQQESEFVARGLFVVDDDGVDGHWSGKLSIGKAADADNALYSSSRLVTLCLSRVRLPASEKFERGEVGEGLMGPYAVVGFFPTSQLLVERGQLIGVGLHFVEFLIVRAVGALHVSVQFR